MKVKYLKAEIIKNGLTQEKIAKMIGITPKTFYEKMKKGVFKTDEVEKIAKILNIENSINDIFFKS